MLYYSTHVALVKCILHYFMKLFTSSAIEMIKWMSNWELCMERNTMKKVYLKMDKSFQKHSGRRITEENDRSTLGSPDQHEIPF